ncbi:MAG: hypothetical protein MZW92_19965 [Comamonadaceae bacterium]|nr:hypothetical protein [Comamonadaceae bacterium]
MRNLLRRPAPARAAQIPRAGRRHRPPPPPPSTSAACGRPWRRRVGRGAGRCERGSGARPGAGAPESRGG